VSGPPEVYTIWATPHTNVGSVTVWNTPDMIYITYATTGRWWLESTDTHVALKLKDIPQKNHVPKPDRFEFQNDWKPRVQTCTLSIEKRDGWDVGKYLYIATHSVVVHVDSRGRVTQREEGWAGPYFFVDGSVLCYGPTYIKYTVKDAYKDVNLPLPTTTCKMAVYFDGDRSRFNVVLSGVPGSTLVPHIYDVFDGTWPGWCAQYSVSVTLSGLQDPEPTWLTNTVLLSSQDPVPTHDLIENTHWVNVNYLLNHRPSGAASGEVQIAIWYLLTPNDSKLLAKKPLADHPDAEAMYLDALANGNDWRPGTGQFVAVLCDAPVDPYSGFPPQLVFIEVDP